MNRKNTKRALCMSFIAMLLCCSMLVGSTFAWFTDTATTNVNTIQSGKLDVELLFAEDWGEYKTGDSAEGATLDFIKAEGTEKVLWEPGCTYRLPKLQIKNNGNLALKYQIMITGIAGDAKLNEAIEWTMTEGSQPLVMNGQLLEADAVSGDIEISGHMKEDAGNEYMDKTIDGIAITVVATQLAHEFDSFTDQYDKDALIPGTIVSEETAKAMLDKGGVVDFNDTEMFNEIVGDNNYGANLREYTFKAGTVVKNLTLKGNSGATRWLHTEGDVTFENVVFEAPVYACHFDSGKGSLTFKNCKFTGWNAIGSDYDKVTFENCEFYHSGRNGMARIYTNTQFINCTFGQNMRVETGKGGLEFHIKNCTYDETVVFYQSEGSTIIYE